MKNYTILHIFLFLLLMLVYQCVSAQDYVLTTRGDSLTGEVRPLLYGPQKKVQITAPGKEKNTLSLFEVREFASNGEVYHPVKGESGYTFMQLIEPGYLTLYAYQLDNQTRFDGRFLRKLDGADLVVPNLGFKKYISQFLEDCPEIVERVKSGELGKKNLNELVIAYNACVDDRTIDHEKVLTARKEQTSIINAWTSLEERVMTTEFSEKNNALEMITEIRKKIRNQERIPNFLIEGLKNSLKDTGLDSELEQAIKEIN
ncbi:MAG TPA: hypothetical protein VIQ51_17630 [Chryseosolibacter sp.]